MTTTEDTKITEALALYAELLDHKGDVGQAFLNGYRRCLMNLRSFIPTRVITAGG